MTPPPQAPERTCPACGGPLGPWLAVHGGEPSDERRYELLRCGSCASAVTVEPPPPGAYETGLYSPAAPRFARPLRALMRASLGQVRRLLPERGRVLDAGAGSGLLVQMLRDTGVDAYGIEPGERGIARAADAGRPVHQQAIEEHQAAELDAAVMWHVLEHVEEPSAALQAAHGWLRPGGRLVVGVPNLTSLQARIAGPAWFHLDAPRHRTHFSRAGMRELLERNGFDVVDEKHFVVEHNLHGMWFALLGRLGMTPGFPFHLLKRNVPARPRDLAILGVAGPLLGLPALLLEAGAALARRGGTIAVVAQRRP